MICYKDKTFCNKGDKNSEKCRACDRFFDEDKYEEDSKKIGYKMPISFYWGKPCEKERKTK